MLLFVRRVYRRDHRSEGRLDGKVRETREERGQECMVEWQDMVGMAMSMLNGQGHRSGRAWKG